jgi:hypothetical protein
VVEEPPLTAPDDVVERITLAPDAGLVRSLGANHTLESAIADLVDNSVDAGASRVSIRLLTKTDRLTTVEVLDNGYGMDSDAINAAMTIGHQRAYRDRDLGHFGMGLKAASFGHCNVLTVWSAARSGTPVGRRIRRADFSKDFTCEVLSADAAAHQAEHRRSVIGCNEGTSVVWTDIRNSYRGHGVDEARRWLATRSDAVRLHLGITFHRLLAADRLALDVLVDELDEPLLGPGVPVLPIDPFGYRASGHPDYPKVLVARAGGKRVKLTCHIWPGKTDVTGFRMGARSGEHFQGFFIFRHDRLLQAGGWSDTANSSPARQLARVVLDDSNAIGSFLTMNPEKSGLKFEPIFHDAINRARAADGTTFLEYLRDAESVYTEANRRRRRRHPVIRPAKGFAPGLRRQIGRELPFTSGEGLELKWRQMAVSEFLDVDLQSKTLWINSRYRHWFAPSGGSLNDAPILKALLFLLTHQVFEGQHLGSKDKDNIVLWKSILGAAVLAEEALRGEGRSR